MVIYAQDPKYLDWAAKRLGVQYVPAEVRWLTSLSQEGNILGVVVFSRFTPGNCEITVVSESPTFISKKFGYAVALYAFSVLDCRRVTAFTAVGNAKSFSLAQQLGFRVEGIVRKWFPGSDAYILGLLREDCKWLKENYGRRRISTSNS